MEVKGQRFSIGEIIFAGVFIVASSITWIFATSLSSSYERSLIPFLSVIIISALSFVVLILIEPINKWIAPVVLGIGFISAIPIAFWGDATSIAIGVPVAFLGGLFAVMALWRASRIKESLSKPLLVHMARRTLPLYFAGVSIVLTAIVFSSPLASDAIAKPVPDALIRFGVKALDPLVEPMLGISIQEDIDSIIRRGNDKQLERIKNQLTGDGVFEGIDLSAIEEAGGINNLNITDGKSIGEFIIDDEIVSSEREAYGNRLGIEIKGDDNIADIIIKLIDRQMIRLEEQLKSFYKIGFFISAFFLFQLLSLPFLWITIGLSALVLWLMRIFGGVNIIEVPVVKKKLIWGSRRDREGES